MSEDEEKSAQEVIAEIDARVNRFAADWMLLAYIAHYLKAKGLSERDGSDCLSLSEEDLRLFFESSVDTEVLSSVREVAFEDLKEQYRDLKTRLCPLMDQK
jgi:hypothetical protein